MSTFFLNRFDTFLEGNRYDLLLVYVGSDAFNETDFRDKINEQVDKQLAPDEILVVLRDPITAMVVDQFSKSITLSALKRRLRNKTSISVRSFGHDGKEASKTIVHGTSSIQIPFEYFIRRTVTKLVRDHNGFVNAAGNYHFELPSGRHTERFIRISNMLVESAEISFVALGLLPYTRTDAGTFYIDTPALFPIVSAVSDHLRAFVPTRQPLIAENFHSYSGASTFSFDNDQKNIVLISASSSGRLGQQIIGLANFDSKQIVHLLYSGPDAEKHQIICNIRSDSRLNPNGFSRFPQDHKAGLCPLCDAHSPLVQLVGDHFELPGPKPIALTFGIGDLNRHVPQLMERTVGQQVFRVGFGRSNQSQISRQFDISPVHLFKSLKKSGRLPYVLNQATPASLGTIVCLNEASRKFGKIIQQTIVASAAARSTQSKKNRGRRKSKDLQAPETIMASDLDSQPVDKSIQSVMVAANVIESGRSLLEVSRDLRRPFPNAPRTYIVGLAKYTSELAIQKLRTNLTQTHAAVSHEFIPIEQIQLPSSSEINAWIAEKDLLSNKSLFFEGMPDNERLDWERRLARLRKQTEPLVNDLFVSSQEKIPIKLQPGFALWAPELASKGSQADVFFTIASIFQNLRAKEEDEGAARVLRSDLFQQTLVDPGNFGRFNDGIIQAAILRAAHPNELDYSASPNDSYNMARYARRMIESADKPKGEAAAELLIAILTWRLRFHSTHYKEVLAPAGRLPSRVERLRLVAAKALKKRGVLKE